MYIENIVIGKSIVDPSTIFSVNNGKNENATD